MPLRGDICKYFSPTVFRFYLRKKYKRSNTFAKRMGVSENTVCSWRYGQKNPTWRHLIKMAEILNIAPRLLIVPSKRHILDKWEDHLIDYLEAPPEVREQTTEQTTTEDGEVTVTQRETETKRKLKLTAKEAIDLAEKLGYFDNIHIDDDDVELGEAEDQDADLLEEGDAPEAYIDGEKS